MNKLILLSILSIVAVSQASTCLRAYSKCEFEFIGTVRIPNLRLDVPSTPQVPISTRIVAKDASVSVGVVNMDGVIPEIILKNGVVKNITKVGTPRLTPTHFKPLHIQRTIGSGIGFEAFDGNQLHVAVRRCIRLYFSSYQVLQEGDVPSVVNVNVEGKDDTKCVVFKTRY